MTTTNPSAGQKIKAQIAATNEIPFYNLPDAEKEKFKKAAELLRAKIKRKMNSKRFHEAESVAEHLTWLTENGKYDLEYFADACKEIERIVTTKDDENTGGNFMDALSKHTRQNFLTWVRKWQEFFSALGYYSEAMQMYNDYWNLHWLASITQRELEEIKAKYEDE